MKIGSNQLRQAYQYDFTKDGGATGNILSGIQIPALAQINFVQIFCLVAPLSAGATTISIGTTTTPTLITAAIGKASFIANQWVTGLGLTPLPCVMDGTLNIVTSIATGPLTAGKFNVYISYYFAQ